ncbi:hypothetical protein CR513_48000, partial [Mucuna pruriens]
MVKKPSGKWRMCTDYTDLNKAYPKDLYPLLSIDRLVGRVLGFALLSFMDVYSGYNQIRMHPYDEAKIAFIIDADTFCYKVMPFGLKNARTTYQRLMDKIFKDVLGTNMEVHVEDMVIKLATAGEHCGALDRVFSILRKHQLKRNPKKCSFGVQARKFLGFVLTERGIEANLEKCQAVINMRSPQSMKEALLAAPPVLTRPTPSIPLLLYIFVSDDALSAALLQEKEGGQFLIYFMSKVLQGAEKRYQKIEKATYFQGYSIIVQTDLPIRQVLRKLDLTGRMVAWSVTLLDFDISFERRGHIKVQALADFITELAPDERLTSKAKEWFLFVDGASNKAESGAGIILEGPNEVLIEQSLHFEFRASNNQVEYKALLAGMRLAQELEAKVLTAKSDSKLITK